jgi:NAD(P)-dependent dehydrogenase (short-subunit alcohol dehydrogenase family)
VISSSVHVGKSFDGKVALITGGSSGIGRATALAFAAEGARVAIGARRVSEGRETVRLVEQAGSEALFVETDVSVPEQVEQLVEAAAVRWQRLDYAVNNAGIEGTPFVPVADYSIEVWDQVIDINLKGVFLSMKYEVPHLLKQQGAAIVNVSSVAGLIGGPGGSAYYASKHGVIGLTKAVAMEYATQGLRVNAVCPAVIRTAMAERFFRGKEAIVDSLHPMGRAGTPEEAAAAILWLCSPQASFITGQALAVDGGVTAR